MRFLLTLEGEMKSRVRDGGKDGGWKGLSSFMGRGRDHVVVEGAWVG